MERTRPPWILVALAALLLAGAGCLGPHAFLPRSPAAGEARFDDETGGIHGIVVSVSYEPVAGAVLNLEPGSRSATTDGEGVFTFDYVEPGRYRLGAQHPDHASAEKGVKVYAGNGLFSFFVLDFSLDRRPHAAGLHRSAYLACGVGLGVSLSDCAAADASHSTSVDVPVGANVTAMDVQAAWNGTATPSTFALGNGSLRFALNDPAGDLVDNWTSHGNTTHHRLELAAGRPAGNWTLDVAPAEGQPTDAWKDAAGVLVGLRVEIELAIGYNGFRLSGAPPGADATAD